MGSEIRTMLESEIIDVAKKLRPLLQWKWDPRFQTALAECSIERKDEVLEILERYLVCRWSSNTLPEAPEVVRAVAQQLGGLMSGQLLLLSDPEKPAFLCCAWWPWGNGQTISIRMAPFGNQLSSQDLSSLTTVFRGWFKI